MALSPEALMRAFIEWPTTIKRPHVSFGLRCQKGHGGGYVYVWGPSADAANLQESRVIIELWNGVVGVRQPLHQHIPGMVARVSAATIKNDPLGYSCGPSFGDFTHGIPPSAMGPGTLYPDAQAVVAAVLAAFAKAGVSW